jgi:hypothetical protein
MEQETDLRASTYTLEIITSVAMTANVAEQSINDSLDSNLVFRFDKVHFYLAENPGQDPLRASKESLASSTEANTLSLLGWKPTVLTIRAIALIGLGLFGTGCVFAGKSAHLQWLGSMTNSNGTLYTWYTSGIKTLDDAKQAAADGRAALSRTTDDFLVKTNWKLLVGGKVVSEVPRHVVVADTFSHLAHHRAQLGVYLRLLDVGVPAVYGPSADDQRFA